MTGAQVLYAPDLPQHSKAGRDGPRDVCLRGKIGVDVDAEVAYRSDRHHGVIANHQCSCWDLMMMLCRCAPDDFCLCSVKLQMVRSHPISNVRDACGHSHLVSK